MSEYRWHPQEIDQAQALKIIDTRRPRGLFYHQDGDCWIGIDNTDGDAWVEEFATKDDALAWLTGDGDG